LWRLDAVNGSSGFFALVVGPFAEIGACWPLAVAFDPDKVGLGAPHYDQYCHYGRQPSSLPHAGLL
jgi:hypothetical protein